MAASVRHDNTPQMLGRYEVAGHLASGGMADVLLGRVKGPSGFERPVVLKCILPHLARQTSFVEMFLDEARTIARVHHPNVVSVHELGNDGGELFIVMEYLEGESVASTMKRLQMRNERLEPTLAAHIIAEASAGLHAAHELRDKDGESLGIVHRDVSPSNLFLTFDGGVKVIDFGIAKALSNTTRTEVGQLKGKLDYMSPEQCNVKDVDRRSDVFALGIVLYELLTQRRLFKRPTPAATLRAILDEPIIPPSRLVDDCPEILERICLRALARSPDDRHPTALELRRELTTALRTLSPDAMLDELLKAKMNFLFADRKHLKEEMLERVRAGSRPTEFPSIEADEAIDVEIPAATQAPSEVSEAPSVRRFAKRASTSALVAILIAAGLATFFVLSSRPKTAPATASAAPTPIASVSIVVESEPTGANVLVDDQPNGTTPTTLTFAATSTHSVELRKDGYAPLKRALNTDADQSILLALTPLPVASSPTTLTTIKAAPKPTASPSHKRKSDPLDVKW